MAAREQHVAADLDAHGAVVRRGREGRPDVDSERQGGQDEVAGHRCQDRVASTHRATETLVST